jgi:hypothetical protein
MMQRMLEKLEYLFKELARLEKVIRENLRGFEYDYFYC